MKTQLHYRSYSCYVPNRILWAPPPSTMDAVSATIFDGGQAIRQKHKKHRIKLITRLIF
jgi:hypothetical protein